MIRTLTDARDIYTRGHSDRVSLLAVEIAKEMQLSETTIEAIASPGSCTILARSERLTASY